MRRLIFIVFVAFFAVCSYTVAFADDFPAQQSGPSHEVASLQSGPQKPFYGYVPPPPIRHTWPGGYKVIFHEMMNTLMEHIIGQY